MKYFLSSLLLLLYIIIITEEKRTKKNNHPHDGHDVGHCHHLPARKHVEARFATAHEVTNSIASVLNFRWKSNAISRSQH